MASDFAAGMIRYTQIDMDAALAAERARVVREVVNRLRHKARSQGNTVAQSALMDAAADIQFRMMDDTTAAPRGTGEG